MNKHALEGLRPTLDDRLWARITKTDTCWLWTGALMKTGYGELRLKGTTCYVHRVVFELLVGPIPEGLVIDHLCRVRHCCNPAHLEPVTLRTNWLRGEAQNLHRSRATHCVHGHEFTPENTMPRPGRPAGRLCRECYLATKRKSDRKCYWLKKTKEVMP